MTKAKNPPSRAQSSYLGVYKHSEKNLKKPWFARIVVDRKIKHLGSFESAEDAAIYRDKKAKEFHFNPRLNFPNRSN